MRKLIIAALAVALALVLNLVTPRPAVAATGTAACLTKIKAHYEGITGLHEIFLLAGEKVCEATGNINLAKLFVVDPRVIVITSTPPPGSRWEKDFNSLFKDPKGFKEPGLLNMAGPLLRESARTEAKALWQEKRSGSLEEGTIKAYEDRVIHIIGNNPNMAFGVKLALHQTLERIATAGPSTDGERAFLQNMRMYIEKMNVRVAQSALDAYDVWKAGEGSEAPKGKLMVLMDYGTVPPDFNRLATAAIMGSAVAMGTVVAITSGAGILSAAMTGAVGTSLYALLSGAGTSSAVAVGGLLGPAAIVVGALVIAGVAIYEMDQITKARPKLEKALTKARQRVDVGNMLATPDGLVLVRYYFAKATSEYSPTGMKFDTSGCQACFYEHANFQGQSFCTTGRENDLHKKEIEEIDFHWGDKITSVKIDKDKCTNSYVRLFENKRMSGKSLQLTRSHPNISNKERGRGNWDDKVSSLEFIDKGAPRCEVCIYKNPDYKGGYFCAQGAIPDLRGDLGWSDKASSIEFNIKSCPKGKVWLYEDENFKGKSIALTSNNNNFKQLRGGTRGGRREWNDDVTSFYFAPSGTSPYSGRRRLRSEGCESHVVRRFVSRSGFVGNRIQDRRFNGVQGRLPQSETGST